VYGYCDPLNGTCNCNPNYYGVTCNEKCIDSKCSIFCLCNDTCEEEEISCMNDITINNQNFSLLFSTNYSIRGNLSIDGSNLNLTSAEITTYSSITISNSNIFYSSSTIISYECIKLSNTTITVDLSQQPNISKLLLFNSTIGCLLLDSYKINYLNEPKCTTLINEENSYSFYIIFEKQPDCGAKESQNTIPSWEIALIIVGSVVGVALIFIIIVLIVPSLRRKICTQHKM